MAECQQFARAQGLDSRRDIQYRQLGFGDSSSDRDRLRVKPESSRCWGPLQAGSAAKTNGNCSSRGGRDTARHLGVALAPVEALEPRWLAIGARCSDTRLPEVTRQRLAARFHIPRCIYFATKLRPPSPSLQTSVGAQLLRWQH